MTVQLGDKVSVEYVGKLEDDTIFDSSEKHGQPLKFKVGEGQVIKGFDKGVLGMSVGEEKKIEIEPAEGYGERNEGLKQEVPKEALGEGVDPKVGQGLVANLPNGQKVPAEVVAVNEKTITIDLNHPLAGKKLKFFVKLVDIGY